MHFTQFYLVLPSFIWFFYLFVLPFYKLFRIVSLTGINTDYVGKDWLAETLLLPTSFFFRVFTVSLHIRSPSFLALQIRFFFARAFHQIQRVGLYRVWERTVFHLHWFLRQIYRILFFFKEHRLSLVLF